MPRQLSRPYLKLNADKQADCWFAYSREENGTLNFYVKGLSEGCQYTKSPELFNTPFFALENTVRMVFFKQGDSFIRQFLTPGPLVGRTLAEDIGDQSSKSPTRSNSLALEFKLLENIPEYHGNQNNLEPEIPEDAPVVAADTPVVAEDAPVVAADAPVVAADAPVVAADAPHSFSLDALTYEMELTTLQEEIKNYLKELWPFNNIPNDGSRQKTIYQICLGILGGHCSELSEDIQHSIRTIRHSLMIDEYIVKDFAHFPDTLILHVSGFVCALINKIHDINKCENEDLPMSKVFPERLRGKTILMSLKEQYIELLKEQKKFSADESLVEKVSEIKDYLKRSLNQDDVEQELDALVKQADALVKQANDEQEAQDRRVALALVGDLDEQEAQDRRVAHGTGNAIILNLPALKENNIASHPKSFFNSPKTAGLVGGATGASIWGGVAAALILCCSKALPFIIITVMIAALLTAITALAFQKCLGPSIQNA